MAHKNKNDGGFWDKHKWIFWTVLFMAVVTVSLGVILWNTLIGCIVVLLIMIFLLAGSFIRAYTERDERPISDSIIGSEDALDAGDLKRSKGLLRYATAILAFLSLITTANGMQDFIFDKGWMSYLGSFAVQSILVVFSLLLCRFYVQITRLGWPKYIKKTVTSLLIVFFCVALLVSSTFSFSYISNYAYAKTWPNDSEMIIQTHLMDAVYDLRNENERRGNLILTEIRNTADDKLKKAIESISTQNSNQIKSELEEAIKSASVSRFESKEDTLKINWEALYNAFPGREDQVEPLEFSYENVFKPGYIDNVDNYNEVIDITQSWSNDASSLSSTNVSDAMDILALSISSMNSLVSQMESGEWRTYLVEASLKSHRTDYITAGQELISHMEILNRKLETIHTLVGQFENIGQDVSVTNFDNIMSKIYLLGIDEDIKLEKIVEEITDLALNAARDENFSSGDIANVMDLRDLLENYGAYKNLKNDIDLFIDANLRTNYQIEFSSGSDEDNTVESTEPTASSTEVATQSSTEDNLIPIDVTITEEKWRSTRSADFNAFYKMIKSLPRIKEAIVEGADNNKQIIYNQAEVIKESSQIHRDLLGDTKDLEKAFSYFKYRFPFMACVSAFIAVFFDFGSFFTGCFLYATEFFKLKDKETDATEVANDGEQIEDSKNCQS